MHRIARDLTRVFSDEFFVIHFLRRDVDSVQQCENVVNPGEKGISYEFSLRNLGRKIGKIRRIVGRRTCAASTPFAEGVRKIREGGDRVEFSPPRYRRCPENSTEYRRGKSVEFTRHESSHSFLFLSRRRYFSRLSSHYLLPGKIHRECCEATHMYTHTHTRTYIYIYTRLNFFFFTFTFGTGSA